MAARLLISLILGFLLGTIGLVLAPDLGRLAGPLLCAGDLVHGQGPDRLDFRCVAADGQSRPVPTLQVLLSLTPICALVVLLPVSLLYGRAQGQARRVRRTMDEDLAVAVSARAEVLQGEPITNPRRQVLMRAVELRLTLWVQAPNSRPYEATTIWFIEHENLHRISRGTLLSVRVNPRQPQRIYPAEPWAAYAWWR